MTERLEEICRILRRRFCGQVSMDAYLNKGVITPKFYSGVWMDAPDLFEEWLRLSLKQGWVMKRHEDDDDELSFFSHM